ncbi:protocatechuate 3,4-dioxygenase beta subunit [Flaviramulus basaltis]|uniref:Protocatechuate 3,4-dioxygenase beta subunit n=1 Tax=Flaviramulus basaltis TaxID=369401 RepID=A0A1K2IGM4_9FLAO|nr:hypothetical protein [Flaviramulus basaltis]SFZ91577.1 protocatechuate 3,4-dioxygenase beta subunit [Flaviramulus basaltis]
MKNLIILTCLTCFISTFNIVNAQETASLSDEIPQNFKKRSPIYDYSEKQLNNVDTIPDFTSKSNKLKITGTIYESDGVTPAKNVLLFIHQTDEDGNFELKRENKKRYVHHRGWIKTDADGRYTFYTFVPGSYIYGNELKQILPIIKEPGKPEHKIETFVFDDDPLLKASCRDQIEQTNPNRILHLDKEEGLFVAKRDIILGKEDNASY